MFWVGTLVREGSKGFPKENKLLVFGKTNMVVLSRESGNEPRLWSP